MSSSHKDKVTTSHANKAVSTEVKWQLAVMLKDRQYFVMEEIFLIFYIFDDAEFLVPQGCTFTKIVSVCMSVLKAGVLWIRSLCVGNSDEDSGCPLQIEEETQNPAFQTPGTGWDGTGGS